MLGSVSAEYQRSVPGLVRTLPSAGNARSAEIHQSPECLTNTHVPRASRVGSSCPVESRPAVFESMLISATSGVINRIESTEKVPPRVVAILAKYASHPFLDRSSPGDTRPVTDDHVCILCEEGCDSRRPVRIPNMFVRLYPGT